MNNFILVALVMEEGDNMSVMEKEVGTIDTFEVIVEMGEWVCNRRPKVKTSHTVKIKKVYTEICQSAKHKPKLVKYL